MKRILRKATNFLDRTHRRLSSARPGSVLILVVVLVVLLALMGTALLSTTRSDRYTATQNAANTQVDLIIEGVKQIAQAVISEDMFGTVGTARPFRPPADSWAVGNGATTFDTFDAPSLVPLVTQPLGYDTGLWQDLKKANDIWLSPRVPILSQQQTYLYWPALGRLPGISEFDSPFAINSSNQLINKTTYGGDDSRITTQPGPGTMFTPTHVQPPGESQVYPAWCVDTFTAPRYVLAADADGDGIADSGFMKLPIGEIDGVTYYWAARIVDNNSAINVNTALSRNTDFKFDGTLADSMGDTVTVANTDTQNNLGVFRSHVGLMQLLLNPAKEMDAINTYRFRMDSASWGLMKDPVDDDSAVPRSDFIFSTFGDLLEHQLARRIDNPGYRSGPARERMRAFAIADSAALAYHNVLLNLEAPPSPLESALWHADNTATTDSVYQSAANYPSSTNASVANGRSAYSADQVGQWFQDNFNYADINASPTLIPTSENASLFPATRSLRSILTSFSTTSNQIPARGTDAANTTLPVTEMPPYAGRATPAVTVRSGVPKTNVNTATFEELWRAYWCVMAEPTNATGTPFVNGPEMPVSPFQGMAFNSDAPFKPQTDPITGTLADLPHPQRMFRTSIRDMRDPTTTGVSYFENSVELQLRAAIAAVQTKQIRNGNDPQVQTIALPLTGPAGTPSAVQVTIFGTSPQPFITEVYAATNIDTAGVTADKNDAAYVAIELYNPYSVAIQIDPASWRIVAVDRTRATWQGSFTQTDLSTTVIGPLPSITINPNDYAVLESFDRVGGIGPVHYRPKTSQLAETGDPVTGNPALAAKFYYVPNLHEVLNKEMVIVRNTIDPLTSPQFDQSIDSFDFSDITTTTGVAEAIHYVRANFGAGAQDQRWLCVYPGRYNGNQDKYRQQGTEHVPGGTPWNTTGLTYDTDPWTPPTTPTLGAANPVGTIPCYLPIQLNNLNFGGPNPPGAKRFPFGGFARDGDILQVPYVAAYTVYYFDSTPTYHYVEMNSVSMDAAFAEDSYPFDDYKDYTLSGSAPITDPGGAREQVGRFCPLYIENGGTAVIDDYAGDPTKFLYAWASDLFEYLTVQSPSSDYSPAANPNSAESSHYTAGALKAVDNDGNGSGADEDVPGGSNVGSEDSLSVQGKININTAPWPVLAMIPWMPTMNAPNKDQITVNSSNSDLGAMTIAPNNIDDNIEIAKLIVAWRDGDAVLGIPPHGPFRTLFDLYRVTDSTGLRIFDTIQNDIYATASKEPDDADGDWSPYNGASPAPAEPTDHSRYDFEEQYLLLTKVSNLITTHSDSFTVYIVVQGWQGVGGTTMPKLVVQRRAAFIQDRSTATKSDPNLPAAVNVPND
jgi:hypothetical protein